MKLDSKIEYTDCNQIKQSVILNNAYMDEIEHSGVYYDFDGIFEFKTTDEVHKFYQSSSLLPLVVVIGIEKYEILSIDFLDRKVKFFAKQLS